MTEELVVHTIRHSDHDFADFVRLLRDHDITLVADVRSQPYSRWTPQFNREVLARRLRDEGLAYRFMRDTLGGRPSDRDLYDPGEEHPNYARMEQTPAYQSAIKYGIPERLLVDETLPGPRDQGILICRTREFDSFAPGPIITVEPGG